MTSESEPEGPNTVDAKFSRSVVCDIVVTSLHQRQTRSTRMLHFEKPSVFSDVSSSLHFCHRNTSRIITIFSCSLSHFACVFSACQTVRFAKQL